MLRHWRCIISALWSGVFPAVLSPFLLGGWGMCTCESLSPCLTIHHLSVESRWISQTCRVGGSLGKSRFNRRYWRLSLGDQGLSTQFHSLEELRRLSPRPRGSWAEERGGIRRVSSLRKARVVTMRPRVQKRERDSRSSGSKSREGACWDWLWTWSWEFLRVGLVLESRPD